MKIVAFLQNPSFEPGTEESVIQKYRVDQDYHRARLAMCMTGQRLMTAFQELYTTIHWDNTNWRPAWQSEEPDHQHMIDVLKREKPTLVLFFGKRAQEAFRAVSHVANCRVQGLTCHHPNARHRTQEDLNRFADKVRQLVLTAELLGQELPPHADEPE